MLSRLALLLAGANGGKGRNCPPCLFDLLVWVGRLFAIFWQCAYCMATDNSKSVTANNNRVLAVQLAGIESNNTPAKLCEKAYNML